MFTNRITQPRMRTILETLLPPEIKKVLPTSSTTGDYTSQEKQLPRSLLSVKLARFLCVHGIWKYLHTPTVRLTGQQNLLALTFDCDYDEDTKALPRLCKILKEENAIGSFACIGALVKKNPGEYCQLVEFGHEIVNHSTTHPYHPSLNPNQRFDQLNREQAYAEMNECQQILHKTLAYTPTGFRTPHFLDNNATFQAAEIIGFKYVSSAPYDKCVVGHPYYVAKNSCLGPLAFLTTRADSADCYPFLMVPLDCCPSHRGDPFSSYHTIRGNSGIFTNSRGKHPGHSEVLTLWSYLLKCKAPSGIACIYFDPMDLIGTEERETLLRNMLRIAMNEGWSFTTMADLAQVVKTGLAALEYSDQRSNRKI